VEQLQLTTADGHRLSGDLAEAAGDAAGAVVVCHPHPLFGGNRFNSVVEAMFVAFPSGGFHTLRFDFRADHDGGVAERLDVSAALDHLAERYPGAVLHTAGYSFGAAVSLAVDDDRIASRVAVAPPLSRMSVDPPPRQPTLVLVAEHDQFCPPPAVEAIVASWPDAAIEVIRSADHFLAGQAAAAAATAARWLSVR
jgi:hypothetical protein